MFSEKPSLKCRLPHWWIQLPGLKIKLPFERFFFLSKFWLLYHQEKVEANSSFERKIYTVENCAGRANNVEIVRFQDQGSTDTPTKIVGAGIPRDEN